MLKQINGATIESKEYDAFFRIYNDLQNNQWMVYPYRDKTSFFPIFEKYDERCEVFLFVNGDEDIGICRLTTTDKGPYQSVATINSLAINPNYHKKGYGSEILKKLIEYTKEKYPQVLRLELAFEGDNPVAMLGEFYSKNGFKTEVIANDWFASRAAFYKDTKHPWYTAEYFACYMLEDRKKEVQHNAEVKPSDLTVSAPQERDLCTFRQASSTDVTELVNLYNDQLTNWSHYPEQSRIKLVEESINTECLFVAYDESDNTIVAACEVELKPESIEHTVILQNLVIAKNNAQAAAFFLQQLINHFKNMTEVKRLELNVAAGNKMVVHELERGSFKCSGTFPCRFRDTTGTYWDEYLFEYSFFGLEDAIECLEYRKKSEKNLRMSGEKFYLPLSPIFLRLLEEKLKDLKITNLSFVEKQIIYQLVRIICTQDYYSAESRRKEYKDILKSNPNVFTNSYVSDIYEIGLGFLKPRLEKNHPLWAKKSPANEELKPTASVMSPRNL